MSDIQNKSKYINWQQTAQLYAKALQNPNCDSGVKNEVYEAIEEMGALLDKVQKANPTWFEAELSSGVKVPIRPEPHTVAVYREDDGHTYYFSPAENEWIAFPTFKDGTPDWLNPTALSDIELSERDLHNLKEWLSGIELDHGLRNFDPNDPEYWKENQ